MPMPGTLGATLGRPLWSPVPPSCKPRERDGTVSALREFETGRDKPAAESRFSEVSGKRSVVVW